uniref:F-box associated domain-containing protein n=1 Tax=Arundo donax TaxID=35708 RepID=A0A0A9E713_ARUDO
MVVHSDHCASLFRGLCPARGVFWNGSVVWIAAHSLVRFVIEGEHVTKMPMPSRKKDWICAYIGESGGHLQMIGYTKEEKLTACFDILEMQEGQSEWSVLYRVDLNRVKELYPGIEIPTWDTLNHQHKVIDYIALSPIYVIRGTKKTEQHGILIFSVPGKIMSYNMEDQEVSVIQEVMSPGIEQLAHPFELFWYSFYAYNSSLFPL